jgi:transposase InsO family protein
MTEDERIIVFKFGIISPVIHGTQRNQAAYFREMAKKTYSVPGLGAKKYKWRTFKRWLHLYRKYGYAGLKPKTRGDKGKSRKITDGIQEKIIAILSKKEFHTVSNLYRYLLEQRIISIDDFTEVTLRNNLKVRKISLKRKKTIPRKAFEVLHINILWIADFMHGPYIKDGKAKRKTYLCVIIDDHSRVLVGYGFFFAENTYALEVTLKLAVLTYGIPVKFYCDNAKIFVSGYIHMVCARLAIALIHSEPHEPEPRGKIERVIRTIRDRFLRNNRDFSTYTLKQLNDEFSAWVREVYHKEKHSSIGSSPLQRYMKDLKNTKIREICAHEADEYFYNTILRYVRKDCTVQVNKKLYEVPPKYIGTKVEIRFPVDDPSDLRLFDGGKQILKLTLLDKNYNAENTIRYQYEQEEDDV